MTSAVCLHFPAMESLKDSKFMDNDLMIKLEKEDQNDCPMGESSSQGMKEAAAGFASKIKTKIQENPELIIKGLSAATSIYSAVSE